MNSTSALGPLLQALQYALLNAVAVLVDVSSALSLFLDQVIIALEF